MSVEKLKKVLSNELGDLKEKGTLKGKETVVSGVKTGDSEKGTRYFLLDYPGKEFIRLNSNSYLGMSIREEVIKAEEEAARVYGAGPGAVRFISGTFKGHIDLENRLAEFHGRESAMLFSSAYTTVMGTLAPLITDETTVISDELNHNCIINAIKLSRPKNKSIYKHLNMEGLEEEIKKTIGTCKRLIIVTDGIFSMRGDNAPLNVIMDLAKKYDSSFEENIIVVVDDSHGIGAFGKTGRGTEEYTGAKVDLLIATLGKGLGVNGGYVVGDSVITQYLREKSPFYIYSNPITPSEAAAAFKALEILDSPVGIKLLEHLRNMTNRLKNGLVNLGYETIMSEHPVVPLLVRDTKKTADLVAYLKERGVLATGLSYPVVPKGDEEIRFQVCADLTENDIDYVLEVLKEYKQSRG
jgi:glycine C-acetyltransferase